MSGGKIGYDSIGFEIPASVIALVVAGGAEAVEQARQAIELTKAIRELETQLQKRRDEIRAAGKLACAEFDRAIGMELSELAKRAAAITGQVVPACLKGESIYESFIRLTKLQDSHRSVAAIGAKPLDIKSIHAEVQAIAMELLPYEWPQRTSVEIAFSQAQRLLSESVTSQTAQDELIAIRNNLRKVRPAHMKSIEAVESLRRQYADEVARARALYAVTDEQIAIDDFSMLDAEKQIARLREINKKQRERLNHLYNNPTYAMTPEARKKAVRQTMDRIESAMRALGNEKTGSKLMSSAATSYYGFGNAYLRCTVAENGTVVIEVVGDAFGDKNSEAIVDEMARFQQEFNKIQATLKSHGVGFEKLSEYLPCPDAVSYEDVQQKTAEAARGSIPKEEVLYESL